MNISNSIGDERTLGPARESGAGEPTLREGAAFGPFRVVRQLGRGAMGEVYEVVRLVDDVPFALKLIGAELGHEPQAIARFEQETRVLRELKSPNIVAAAESGQVAGRLWLSMQLCAGLEMVDAAGQARRARSLDEYAEARGGVLTQLELLTLMDGLLAGLAYAHDKGVVHRDLKPANILLAAGTDGRPFQPLISDFGLVRMVGEERIRERVEHSIGESLTRGAAGEDAKAWLGNWAYMSPEQKRGQPATRSSDLYAVGLLAYRLGTGKDLGLEAATELNPDLVPEWDEFIGKALEELPEHRYASAQEMREALARVRAAWERREAAQHRKEQLVQQVHTWERQKAASRSEVQAGPARRGAGFWHKRIGWAVGGVTLGVVLLGAGLIWQARKPSHPQSSSVAVPLPAADARFRSAAGTGANSSAALSDMNPFDAAQDAQLVEAIRPIARGAVLAVNNNLEALGFNGLTNPAQREWIRVLQAITLLADRREGDAEALLNVLPAQPGISTNSAVEQDRLPLTVAHYLLKKSDDSALAVTNALTPAWYPPLTKFAAGLREWMTGTNRYGAVALFEAYRPASSNEPAWPFAFRGLADHWIKQNQELDRTTDGAQALAKAKKFAEARKLLEAFKVKCSPALQGALSYHIKKLAEQEGGSRTKEDEAKSPPTEPADKTATVEGGAREPAKADRPAEKLETPPDTLPAAYAFRSPENRKLALHKYAGTYADPAELAVVKALRWLQANQRGDGGWAYGGRLQGSGGNNDVAVSSLALLCYLAYGKTASDTEFGLTVEKAINFIKLKQNAQGYFGAIRASNAPQTYPYIHGLATYAMCEACGMTRLPSLQPVMDKAVQIIMAGQQEGSGGWDYQYAHGTRRDTSIGAWQVQALKAALLAGCTVPGLKEALDRSGRDMKKVYDPKTGRFGYEKVGSGSMGMTGAATLCLQFTGHSKDVETMGALRTMHDLKLSWETGGSEQWPLYAFYYITQAKFHESDATFSTWNDVFAPMYIQHQNADGSWPAFTGKNTEAAHGAVYCTTLAALTLEIYYRYPPIGRNF